MKRNREKWLRAPAVDQPLPWSERLHLRELRPPERRLCYGVGLHSLKGILQDTLRLHLRRTAPQRLAAAIARAAALT